MKRIRRYGLICLAMVAAFGVAASGSAAIMLNIDITGLKFKYDGATGLLYDSNNTAGSAGGNGLISEASKVTRISLSLIEDGVKTTLPSISTTTGDTPYCDFLMDGIFNIPKSTNTSVQSVSNGSGFGFDLLSANLGRFLQLSLDNITVSYSSATSQLVVAGGVASGLVSQSLPNDIYLSPTDPIWVTIKGSVSATYTADNYVKTLTCSSGGTGNVYGTDPPAPSLVVNVPEPVCFVALLAMAVFGFEAAAYRKRRR